MIVSNYNLSRFEKLKILNRYLVENEMLTNIYEDFKEIFKNYRHFSLFCSYLQEDRSLVLESMQNFEINFNPITRIIEFNNSKLDSKKESYWKDEEELYFKPANIEDLSSEEIAIYVGK